MMHRSFFSASASTSRVVAGEIRAIATTTHAGVMNGFPAAS